MNPVHIAGVRAQEHNLFPGVRPVQRPCGVQG